MFLKLSFLAASIVFLASSAIAEEGLSSAEQVCWAKVSQSIRFVKAPTLEEQRKMIESCMNEKPSDKMKDFVMPLPSQEYGY